MLAKLFYFHLVHVHCWFIFGHGWLHSNKFCKTCRNCICPSWRCLPAHNGICGSFHNCANSKLGRRQFWHALQKWLLSSHPWPNMKDQCTLWKKNRCYQPLITILWYYFLMRDLGQNLGFFFFKFNCFIFYLHCILDHTLLLSLWR